MKNLKIYFLASLFIVLGCSQDNDNMGSDKGDGTGGSLAIFALKGNYLYTVDHSKLNVFSLLNQNQPTKVNDLEVGFAIETLFSDGNYLYIGSREGMYIYSIENPENPQLLSSVQHFTACDPVVANATHAFVTLHSNTVCGNNTNLLEVYDTSDLNHPLLIHSRNLVQPRGLGLYGNYLLVCDDVIKIFDIQNPIEPVVVATINKNCFDVIIKEDTLFAIGDQGLFRYRLNPNAITDIVAESEILF